MTKFICTCLFRESLTMPLNQYPGEQVKTSSKLGIQARFLFDQGIKKACCR